MAYLPGCGCCCRLETREREGVSLLGEASTAASLSVEWYEMSL